MLEIRSVFYASDGALEAERYPRSEARSTISSHSPWPFFLKTAEQFETADMQSGMIPARDPLLVANGNKPKDTQPGAHGR